ncbi:MAG: LptF/LptG family permease [Candidatus Eisenbacteria bacterium]|nr:LptF/LptG family permease [Candidatus Eisenbacteria bacterium]
MRILSRYVLRAHVVPALAGLAIFYFVLSMDFLVDYLELFIKKGVPLLAVLEAFGLSLAWMTLLAVPMAVMVAVLTAFGRLAGDNEITALRATGTSVFRLILPVLAASVLVAAGLFTFGNAFLPTANHRLKTLLVDIHKVRPLATIEPGVLTELPGGYMILVSEIDRGTNEIFDVRIHRFEGEKPVQTIISESGVVSTVPSRDLLKIELMDGEIHELDPEDPTRYNRLVFDRHAINVVESGGTLSRSDSSRRGDRELSLEELAERIERNRSDAERARERLAELVGSAAGDLPSLPEIALTPDIGRSLREGAVGAGVDIDEAVREIQTSMKRIRSFQVEYHKKLSIPFSCIVFVLVGAPLGIRSRRGGVGIGAGIGILFFLIYYLFLIGGEQLGDRGIVSPVWAMWAPNIIFGGLGALLTLAVSFEWRMRPLMRVIDFVLRPPRPSRPVEDER